MIKHNMCQDVGAERGTGGLRLDSIVLYDCWLDFLYSIGTSFNDQLGGYCNSAAWHQVKLGLYS